MLSTHPPLVRVFSLGSACTAEAARNAAIKSAAAAGGESRRDDFMVTNYIDGTIRRAARSVAAANHKGVYNTCFSAVDGHWRPATLLLIFADTERPPRTWLDPDGVIAPQCGVMISSCFPLVNPDWIILCSIYMSLRFLLGPHGALQQNLNTHHLTG